MPREPHPARPTGLFRRGASSRATPLGMLHAELLDPDDIRTISRDGLIMALNRKVDLLTRNVAKAS